MAKGISNETRGVSPKKFRPNPRVDGGLCKAALVDVLITTADVKDDSPMESFRGHAVPRLNFIFESKLDAPGVKKSVYIHSYLPIEHTPESLLDGEGGTAWKWNQMSQTIKHILDVFRNNAPLTPEEEAKLLVDFTDEVDGVFVPQESEVVIAAYQKFFDNVVSLFKPGEKAIFVDDKGTPKVVWIKLLVSMKGKLVNQGDAGFPGYIGDGIIELYFPNVEPSISIKLAKGESIEDTPTTKAAPMGGIAAGSGVVAGASVVAKDIPEFMRK